MGLLEMEWVSWRWSGSPGGGVGLLEVEWVSWRWGGSPGGGVGSALSVLATWPGLMCTIFDVDTAVGSG